MADVTELLVSACNVGAAPRSTCLARLDLQSWQVAPVEVGCDDGTVYSGTGIAADERFVFHLAIHTVRFESLLIVLDRSTLELLHSQTLPEVRDGHSLAVAGDRLYVVSTGQDEVIGYRLDGPVARRPEVVWTPTGAADDTHHVNSIAVVDGALLCTAFGPKSEGGWGQALDGYAHDVTRDRTIRRGLNQPHSLCEHDGRLLCCNSAEGTVIDLEDGAVVARLPGYARGLAFRHDGTMYVGSSVSRRSRVASGRLGNPAGRGPQAGWSGIASVPTSGMRVDVGLRLFALELYDVVSL